MLQATRDWGETKFTDSNNVFFARYKFGIQDNMVHSIRATKDHNKINSLIPRLFRKSLYFYN